MSKFYQTEEFQLLHKEWRKKLQDEEFPDAEDEKGNLKQYDRRTISWDNRDRVRTFFAKLESFLSADKNLIPKHREILTLYAGGARICDISKLVKRSKSVVKDVILITKRRLISLD